MRATVLGMRRTHLRHTSPPGSRALAAGLLGMGLLIGCNAPAPDRSGDANRSTRETATASNAALAPHNGYGPDIQWRSLDDARAESAASGKPMMVLVHASWCGRCKELRPVFEDPKIVAASQELVMVNMDQDEVPEALTTMAPDGKYVPRILFFSPDGARMPQIVNPRSEKFPLYYSSNSRRELLTAMVLARKEINAAPQ